MGFIEHYYSPAALGTNNVTLPTAVNVLNSNPIAVEDCDIVTVYVYFDHVAATDCTFNVETWEPTRGLWFVHQTVAIAAGVATYSDYAATKASGAADKYYMVKLEVPGEKQIRLADIRDSAAAATTDKVIISAVARQLIE